MDKMKWFLRVILGLLTLAALLPAPLLAQGQSRVLLTLTQVDNSTFPKMTAFVIVTDATGAPIKGLDKSSFEAFEDGRSVPVTEVSTVDQSQLGIAVALVMDVSGSMKGQPMEQAKAAAVEFISKLADRDECAVFSFANEVKLLQDFARDKNACINAVNALDAAGNTALHEALFRSAKSLGTRPPGRKTVVFFTDGEQYPPGAAWTLDDGIAEANTAGIPVYTVGLKSPDFKPDPLKKIAEKTNGRYFEAESPDQLKALYLTIIEQLKNQYVVKYVSDLSADRKSHGLLIKVKTPQGEADGIKSFAALPALQPFIRLPWKSGQEVNRELVQFTPADIIAQNPIAKVEYYVDDALKFTATAPPFTFLWNVDELTEGEHVLKVKAFDNATPPNTGETQVRFKVPARSINLMPFFLIGAGLLLVLILAAVFLARRRQPAPVAYPPYVEAPPTPAGIPTPLPSALPGAGPTMPPTTIPAAGPIPSVEMAPLPAKTEIIRKPPAMLAFLIMTKGERVGKEFRLKTDGDTSIGRDAANNDIVVSDGAVSRQHAKIRLEGGVFYLYDLASANGTFVNGQQIQRQPLQDGDVVQLGETRFTFKRA